MRFATLTESGEFVVEDAPEPSPAPDEVVVEIRRVGICGSDVHFFTDHGIVGDDVEWPVVLGHESAGVVAETGADVTGVSVGDRVTVEPGVPCGSCAFCRTGEYHLCRDVEFMADPPVEGAFKERVAWPAEYVYPLPDDLSLNEGALCEPLSVGLHVCERGGVEPGDSVLVTGCGSIGMLSMEAAAAFGATTIAAADVVPEKLERALDRCADVAIDTREVDIVDAVASEVDALGADVVIETTGVEPVIGAAVEAVRPGGSVVQVGFPRGDVSLDVLEVIEKDVDVSGSFRYRNTYPTALELLADGAVDVEGIVDFERPLSEIQAAFQRFVDEPTEVKGVITIGE